MYTFFLSLYSILWKLVQPMVQKSQRMREGWEQRTMQQSPEGPFDLWIQAASGGESILAGMLLNALPEQVKSPTRTLVTSTTPQGFDILKKRTTQQTHNLDVTIAYFPLDAPKIMAAAFKEYAPKVCVLLETELWPAFLIYAKKSGVPVIVVNGRMSEKSYRSYRWFRPFFKRYGPEHVLAISDADQARYAALLGEERVETVDNLKFDNLFPKKIEQNPLPFSISQESKFLLLGSIRKEEEEDIATCIGELLLAREDLVIALFPKHVQRAASITGQLEQKQIKSVIRSKLESGVIIENGTVVIWDTFGELANAYSHADATFVGGSLSNWGGHNFLEPLVYGVRPIIGPHWKHFAWVGRWIVESGLVEEVQNREELTAALLKRLDYPEDKEKLRKEAIAALSRFQGGTRKSCIQISNYLEKSITSVNKAER